MIGKYSQKLLDHAKQLPADAFKTASKKVIQKTAEGTGDFIDDITADAVAKTYDGKIIKLLKIHTKITQRLLQMGMINK